MGPVSPDPGERGGPPLRIAHVLGTTAGGFKFGKVVARGTVASLAVGTLALAPALLR